MQPQWNQLFAGRTRHMTSSAVRELLKVTEQAGFISFAGGLPAPEMFPIDEVSAVATRILRERGAQALQYGPTEGYKPLRQLLADNLRAAGVPVSLEHVLITTGSQSGIDLVGKIFLDPGDLVAVESPTYLAALQAWRAYEAQYLSVPSDADGIDVAALRGLMPQHPKLLYCLPNFQNPRGVTLTRARREALVELTAEYGLPVVEDDPYRELRFEGEHLPRLMALDAARRGDTDTYRGAIIALGSFSKTLAPGLRVGWVVAAPEVIVQLTQAKQGTDLHTATLNQMIAYEMLQSRFLEEHGALIIRTYKERRDTMLEALRRYFPPEARWTRPEGGMFLWVELPAGVDTAELLQRAVPLRVAFVPGAPFHADGSGRNTMRLNFSNSNPEQITEGIRRLGEAIAATSPIPALAP